jgi:hypothetical protein
LLHLAVIHELQTDSIAASANWSMVTSHDACSCQSYDGGDPAALSCVASQCGSMRVTFLRPEGIGATEVTK